MIASDRSKPLTQRQAALVQRLATRPYPQLKQACAELGIPQSTAWRWNQEPHFQAALTVAYADDERAIKDESRRSLLALAEPSFRALEAALKCDDVHAQLKAAFKVIDKLMPDDKPEGAAAANVHVRISLNDREIVRGSATVE